MGFYALPYQIDFKYIDDNVKALETISTLAKHNVLAIDTETTGLDPYTDRLLLLQIGTPEKKCFVYDMRYVSIEILRPFIENPKILHLLHNAVFDYKFIKCKYGVKINNIYDSMLAERLLTLGLYQEANLRYVIKKYLNYEVDKGIRNEFCYFNVKSGKFTEQQLTYAAHDVDCLYPIFMHQSDAIQRENLRDVCKLEFDLVSHIGDMELNGIKIDTDKWQEVIHTTRANIKTTTRNVLEMLSGGVKQQGLFGLPPINLDSQHQLLDALRNLGLPLEDTSEGTLQLFKHEYEVVREILEYRGYSKILSSFGDNILSLINPITGRLHAHFNQLVSTGRLSCSNPNLQQIPQKSQFRECFIAEDGKDLITCFEKSTPVITFTDPSKPLENIAVGERVYTHLGNFKPVVNKIVHTVKEYYELKLVCYNYVYKLTGEHPLFIKGRGWTKVSDCRPGDLVGYPLKSISNIEDLGLTGGYMWSPIESIKKFKGTIEVVNLEVAEDHSYCVPFMATHNCDMSQAELRILASYSNETVFKEAIKAGRDLHAANASFVFNVPYEEVLRDKKLPDADPNKHHYRSKVKAIIFGLCVAAGSQILLADGSTKPIEKIRLGDMIRNDKGEYEVIDVADKGSFACVDILTRSGHHLMLTASHPCLIRRDGEIFDCEPIFFQNNDELYVQIGDEFVFSKLVSTRFAGHFRVYDLSIDEHPYFVANGIVVHNCYGMSKYGLARRLNIPEEEAESLINLFFSKFPNAKRFLDRAAQEPIKYGYSTTISGRKRYYKKPDKYTMSESDYRSAINAIKRRGMNTPIQGCFAEGMHVFGAGYIENNVNKTKVLPVGAKKQLLSKGVFNGYKHVYEITTQLGFSLIGTYDHEISIFTDKGAVRWKKLGETLDTYLRFTAAPYKGSDQLISRALNTFNVKGRYLKDHIAFLYGFALANRINNSNSFKISANINDIIAVFKEQYAMLKVPRSLRTFKESEGIICIKVDSNVGNLVRYFRRNHTYFDNLILQSVFASRAKFLAGYMLTSMYAVKFENSKGLFIKTNTLAESRFIQQVLLSLGIISSSGRRDIMKGSIGCVISESFFEKLEKLVPFIKLEYEVEQSNVLIFKDRCINIEYKGETKVYDMVGASEPHTYICQGIYVHNSNADVIKKATCILGDRLEDYDAELVLQVHDEVVVEVAKDQAEEVAQVVSQSIIDGWDFYFKDVPMEADANIKSYWCK